MSNPCPQVKLKLSLKTFVTNEFAVKDIVEYIKTIPNYQSLKNDLQLLEYILNLGENVFAKKSSPEQKIDFVIKIMSLVYGGMDASTLDTCKKQIQFLINNNHVQRISKLSKISNYFFSKLPSL